MDTESIIHTIAAGLADCVPEVERKSARRLIVGIPPSAARQAARVMFSRLGARFQIATGVDTREGFEVMYHWAMDGDDCVVTVRTLLDHAAPEIDSIAGICPAAEWIEREIWELLGIDFRGHPDLRHLLLDDAWPAGNYPLRRNREPTP